MVSWTSPGTRARGGCVLGLAREMATAQPLWPVPSHSASREAGMVPGTEEELGRNLVMQGNTSPRPPLYPSGNEPERPGLNSVSAALGPITDPTEWLTRKQGK